MVRRSLSVLLSANVLALLLVAGAPRSAAALTPTLTPEVSAGGLGGHSSVNMTLHVAGTEYGGFPPPTTGVVLKFPTGTAISAGDHSTCAKETLEKTGPKGCPAGSKAGPVGNALAIVSFGSERVEESATVESFFAPGGGLIFFADGHTPTSLEILMSATVSGNVVTITVPLISTVPGAPFASLEQVTIRLGESASEEENSHLQSGLVLPSECPTAKLSWAAEVTIDQNGAEPVEPKTYETATETACPAVSPEELLRLKHQEEEAAAKKKAEEEAAKRAEEALDRTIVAALDTAIVPSGKSAELASLLKRDGLKLLFKAPTPGALVISWYQLPKGAHLSARARPVLIASGRAAFATIGMRKVVVRLTRQGKRLLRSARRIRLTAKGVFIPTGKPAVVALKPFTLKR